MKKSIQQLSALITAFTIFNAINVYAADAVAKKAAEETKPAVEAVEAAKPEVEEVKPVAEEAKPVAEETKPVVVEAPIDPKSKFYGKKNRNFGDFVVGPFITLVSLPRPLGFGVETKWNDILGASLGYGFIPQITYQSVKVKLTGIDGRIKFYPFKGAFFIGAGIGSQTITASRTETIATLPITANVSLVNSFVSPQLGWNWTWDSGFFFGIELGVQLTLKNTTALTTDASAVIQAQADYVALKKKVNDSAELIGKYPIPMLTLIKIGYFF